MLLTGLMPPGSKSLAKAAEFKNALQRPLPEQSLRKETQFPPRRQRGSSATSTHPARGVSANRVRATSHLLQGNTADRAAEQLGSPQPAAPSGTNQWKIPRARRGSSQEAAFPACGVHGRRESSSKDSFGISACDKPIEGARSAAGRLLHKSPDSEAVSSSEARKIEMLPPSPRFSIGCLPQLLAEAGGCLQSQPGTRCSSAAA